MKTELNWNEAPEGATLFWTNPLTSRPWFKIENGILYNFEWPAMVWNDMGVVKHLDEFIEREFIERQTDNQKLTVPVVNQEFTTEKAACSKMEPTTWDGEGLPPIGMVCSVFHRAESETKPSLKICRIIELLPRRKIDDRTTASESCVYLIDNKTSREVGIAGADSFFPVRTDRERWITEAQKASSDILSSRQLGKIYDAGLAKLPE